MRLVEAFLVLQDGSLLSWAGCSTSDSSTSLLALLAERAVSMSCQNSSVFMAGQPARWV
ncbi:hypothetical protein [Streptomyces sp.]|uniref:hypothetical protein n=1 Tax=Streptomyces sp. TaxID=1931 RepID=UPI002D7879E5|nr:hypothetical protein [Streptomyces sp.]HET6353458.1 hypothetical protein [Streptomyces sp.]